MVAGEYHCRTLAQTEAVQFIENASHLRIHERHRRVVTGPHSLLVVGIFTNRVRLRPRAGQPGFRDILRVVLHRLGQLDLLPRVRIKILLRRHHRVMRPNQAHRQEERLILVLLQQLNGLRGRLVIRLIRAVAFVPHSHKHPVRHTRGLPILFRGREYIQVQARIKPLRVRLFTGRIETLRPRGCDVQSVRAGNNIARDAHVINLPHPRAVPAVLTKVLTEIHLAGA